jgi:hypothetical protein
MTEVEVIPEKKTKKKRNRCKLKKKKKCRKKDLIDAECVCAPLNPIVSKFNIVLWFLMTARVKISGSQLFLQYDKNMAVLYTVNLGYNELCC